MGINADQFSTEAIKPIMMSKYLSLMAVVSTISCSPLNVESPKAASPYVNIGCQCSPLTFVDQYGSIQGNCRSADSTGARWCYVDNAHSSSCQDLRFSARFPNNPWSYEACATPLPVVVAPVAPSASFTAPYPAHGASQPYTGGAGYGYNSLPNTGTLQPYGQFIPKTASSSSTSSD